MLANRVGAYSSGAPDKSSAVGLPANIRLEVEGLARDKYSNL
jgi:hypothetical protein